MPLMLAALSCCFAATPLRRSLLPPARLADLSGISLRRLPDFRHKVDWRPGGDESLLLGAFFELSYDPVRVLHHPPTHVLLVDGLAFFRVIHEVYDAGESQW